MKLTLCMIVKNEEKNIKECLNKIAREVDEIVVVDTGSTDRTKEIAEGYTKDIYDFSWTGSFSEARNYAAKVSTNDWILVLDGDEVCLSIDKQSLDVLLNSNETLGRIRVLNSLNGRESTAWVSRIYNRQYFEFSGIIHEQLVPIKEIQQNYVNTELTVKHYGYDERYVDLHKKVQRNVELLNKALDKQPKDTYLLYQLGKAYFMDKAYFIAIEQFKRALTLKINYELEYAEDLIECYGYSLINAGRYKESLEAISKYKLYYTESPDYNFLMGLIYMNNVEFKAAVESFKKCLTCNSGKALGVTTYLPLYNIGVIYECLGDTKSSLEYYRSCGEYKPALDRIKQLL